MSKKSITLLLSLIFALSMLLAACAPAATTASRTRARYA